MEKKTRSENRKNSGNRGRSKSKGRGTSTSGRVVKDECAYCREKGHWKKDCPKKRGNDNSKADIVHSDEDDDSNLALLETSVVPQVPVQSVEKDSGVESDDSDTFEGEVPVDSSSQQQQQKDSIATSRPKRVIHVPARYVDMVAYALPVIDVDIPSTFKEAMANLSTFGCLRRWAL
ncbi:hypothetical protein RHSIM_Rhsim11G0139500 [Rhododendron simsii]|uniref:CCHC-type domain-containing protein n=1 Tax=Rhododendron simsii TaxID=118357 RepID=A0A834G676_RHOSS|nr:hypothetical protein RHSIM_Rhsim11G0139500 [Rhododendron simsii]